MLIYVAISFAILECHQTYYSLFSIEYKLQALLVWLNMMASQTFHNSQKFPQPKALVETKENFLYESTEASVAWWSYYPIIFIFIIIVIDGQNLTNLFKNTTAVSQREIRFSQISNQNNQIFNQPSCSTEFCNSNMWLMPPVEVNFRNVGIAVYTKTNFNMTTWTCMDSVVNGSACFELTNIRLVCLTGLRPEANQTDFQRAWMPTCNNPWLFFAPWMG